MADRDLKVKATLDSSDLQADLQKLGRDVDVSLDKAAGSADGLAKSLDKVGDSAKMSASQISSLAVTFSGMALKVGGAYLEAQGQSSAAGYLTAAGSGALQGAATGGMAFGPQGAVIGAGVGAVAGAGTHYFGEEKRAQEAEQRLQDLASSNVQALAEYERLKKAGDESAEFLRKMADESLAVSDRTRELSERMKEFQDAAADLRITMGKSEIQRDAKAFGDALREYARIGQEMSKLESVRAGLRETDGVTDDSLDPRVRMQTGALQRLGIGVGGDGLSSLATIQREGNSYLKSIDNTMRAISVRGNVPVWT